MKVNAYALGDRVIFISPHHPTNDLGCPRFIGSIEIEDSDEEGIEIVVAQYKGIDYHVFGLGKHKMSFLVPDGAIDAKCTYKKMK
jgi:hypothetical protein